MTLQQIQLKGAVSRNRRPGRPCSTSRSIRARSCPVFSRVTWPRAYSRPQSCHRRRESGRRNPSLTNIAQWYLDRRYPAEGPSGLIYALSELPPLHNADEVVKALDSTVASLGKESERLQPMIPAERPQSIVSAERPQSMVESLLPEERPQSIIPVVWNCPNDLWHVRHPPTPLTRISHPPKYNAAATAPSIAPPGHLDTKQRGSAQAVLASASALLNTKPLPNIPIVKQSSLSLDNRLSSPSAHLTTSAAPPVPSPSFPPHPPSEFAIGFAHSSLAAKSHHHHHHPPHRNPRAHSHPILRKAVGSSDRRTRATTLPQLTLTPPTRPQTPACLKIGRPLTGPAMPRKPLSKDSLKLHIPKDRNNEDTPLSLQPNSPKQKPEREPTGLSPGPATEINCLITAVDVVKDSFEPQLDPLEENLGHFSCDFSCSSFSCMEQHHRHPHQHASTSPPIEPDFNNNTHTHAAAVPNQLHPYPLPPRPTHPTASNNPATTTAISNATLTALLAAEDLSNCSAGNSYGFTNYNSPHVAAVSSGSSGSSSGMRGGGGGHGHGSSGGGSGQSPPQHTRALVETEDMAEDTAEDTSVSVAVARAVPVPGTAIHDFASFAHRSFFRARLVDLNPSRERKEKEKEKEEKEKEKEEDKENDLSHLYRIRNRYPNVDVDAYECLGGDDGEVQMQVRAQSEAAIWPRGRLPHSGTLADGYPAPNRGLGPHPYPDRASEGIGSGLFPSRGSEVTGSGSGAGSGPEGPVTATTGQQRRAASLTSWEIRRIKGRGMIFW